MDNISVDSMQLQKTRIEELVSNLDDLIISEYDLKISLKDYFILSLVASALDYKEFLENITTISEKELKETLNKLYKIFYVSNKYQLIRKLILLDILPQDFLNPKFRSRMIEELHRSPIKKMKILYKSEIQVLKHIKLKNEFEAKRLLCGILGNHSLISFKKHIRDVLELNNICDIIPVLNRKGII